MSLMRFVNKPDTAVHDSLCGLKCAYPSLIVDENNRLVISNRISKNRVCVLSGGGSGHEPFATGFVGDGMLSGAVAGLIFASPPSHMIYTAICTLSHHNNNSGVLIIVLNYTGDILNFGLAVEQAKVHNIKVETVVVDEDCSKFDSDVQSAGHRGMCGTCLVIKIAGSMAACGKTLSEITNECRLVTKFMGTLGAAVSPCTVPGVGPSFKINADEVEIGLGIHGEAGVLREKFSSVDALVDIMIERLITALNLLTSAKVCVMINNLGAVSQLEMGIICNRVNKSLSSKNISTVRMYNNCFMTSLDMAGFQICILNTTNNPAWLSYLDVPSDAPSWNATCHSIPVSDSELSLFINYDGDDITITKSGPKFTSNEFSMFEKCLRSAANVIIEEEARLNELDSITGDGDAGTTLKRFADGILQNISTMELEYPAVSFHYLSKLSQNVMGGTSGALYGILLTAASNFLLKSSSINWLAMWKKSLDTLQVYSKAKPGDRTMVDVLLPAYEVFEKHLSENKSLLEAFTEAVYVAKVKCEETRHMKPRLGRASYVPSEFVKDVDPGAYGVMLWLDAILSVIKY